MKKVTRRIKYFHGKTVPRLVPSRWYWSFCLLVLQFQSTDIRVTLMWHYLGIPIDMFLIFVEVHIGVCSNLFEHLPYHFLLLRWKKNIGRTGNFPWIAPAPLTKYLSTTFRI